VVTLASCLQAAEDLAAKRAAKKVATRGEALKRRRAAMNEFLYTVPYVPVAGQKVGTGGWGVMTWYGSYLPACLDACDNIAM
jgi:hypothetical protein